MDNMHRARTARRLRGRRAPTPLDEALNSLRNVLSRHVDDGLVHAAVSEQVRAVCAKAREANVPPERLLVRLKQTFDTLPASGEADLNRRADLRDAVVTSVIRGYFSSET